MIGILGYGFFQNAIIAGILASIACGIMGTYVVVKRMVSISGGISHAAFGGVGLGYFLGIDPIYGAFAFTTAISLFMGILSEKARESIDTLIAAMWAAGMAAGIIFISATPGYAPDLFSFLFGNILLVPTADLILMAVTVFCILAIVVLLFKQLLAVTFDEEYAEIMNLPVTWLSLLLMVLIGVTVVMLIRIVGIILVIALLALPAAISRNFCNNVGRMMVLSTGIGMVFTMGGLWLSYALDIPSGATIIMCAVAGYIAVLGFGRLAKGNGRYSCD